MFARINGTGALAEYGTLGDRLVKDGALRNRPRESLLVYIAKIKCNLGIRLQNSLIRVLTKLLVLVGLYCFSVLLPSDLEEASFAYYLSIEIRFIFIHCERILAQVVK